MIISFLKERLESFRYALRGLKDILRTERNAWVHAAITVIVLALAWILRVSKDDWPTLIIVIALVWVTEAVNTVLELVIDIVSPEFSQAARRAKDIAAAAVLFASIGAVVAGVAIFGPILVAKFRW